MKKRRRNPAKKLTGEGQVENEYALANDFWDSEGWELTMGLLVRQVANRSIDRERARIIQKAGRLYARLGQLSLEANQSGIKNPFGTVPVTADQVARWKRLLACLDNLLKET